MIHLIEITTLTIFVAQPVEVGETHLGYRRVIPILGGEATGPRLNGRILPGGADFQLLRADHTTELHARYVIQLDDGVHVYVDNAGLRHGAPEAMERLRRGEAVDPDLIYFRTVPRFETAHPDWLWLTRHIFVAEGKRYPDKVELTMYQL